MERRPWLLAQKSAPYAWERVLLWALIVACFGIEKAAEVAQLAALLIP